MRAFRFKLSAAPRGRNYFVPATYTFGVVVDDPDPALSRLDREVDWTVTDEACSHRTRVVFTEVDEEPTLSLTAQSCEASEIQSGERP